MANVNADAMRCDAVDVAETLFLTVRRSAAFKRNVDAMTLRELLERSIALLQAANSNGGG